MPFHNRRALLGEAVGSILAQSFEDFELILVDDGSNDGSAEAIDPTSDRRIRMVCLQANCGISTARNVGLSLARGEFIAVMDSDDIALPGRLAAQLAFLEAHDNLHIVGTGIIKDIAGQCAEQLQPAEDAEIKARLLLLNGTAMIHPTTMIRHCFLREHALRYGATVTDGDHELWIRAMLVGARFGNSSDIQLVYRRHGDNITAETSPQWPAHQASKTRLRTQVMQQLFPDLSLRESHAFARLMEVGATWNITEVGLGMSVAERLLCHAEARYGASMPLLKGIFQDYHNHAIAVLAKAT